MNAASLEDAAVDHKVGNGDNDQDNEPRRPGMELVPMAVVVERQKAQNEQVNGGHGVTPLVDVLSMNGAILICPVAVKNGFPGPQQVMYAVCIMML
jgi:hypothetical protein